MRIPSIHKWIIDNDIRTEKGEPITFDEALFLYQMYADFTPQQAWMAASQVGKSVALSIKSAYTNDMLRASVIYTLPSDQDVQEFVPTKYDKIVQHSPYLKKNLTKDTQGIKGMFDTWTYFKGTRSKTAAVMTTADVLIHDEVDRSDQTNLGTFRSRTKRSELAYRWLVSNPSFQNTGVDVQWQRSDKKEWFVQCKHCQEEQPLVWSRNVDYKNKCYRCAFCGHPFDRKDIILGRWIAQQPGAGVSGYHVSQMMAPWVSVESLIEEEATSDPLYFDNFILGLPSSVGAAENFRQLILDATVFEDLDTPPFFMGVDIGATKHFVLGSKEGIFRIGTVQSREQLEAIIEKYNPWVVMDAGPERTWAEEFKQKYPKLKICFFHKDRKQKSIFTLGEKDKSGYIYADRHRSIDAVVNEIAHATIQFQLSPTDLTRYIKHWEVMVRKAEENSLGIMEYNWDKNSDYAQDHWCFSTVYFWLAKSCMGDAEFVPTQEERLPENKIWVPNEHGEIEARDLRDLFDENL